MARSNQRREPSWLVNRHEQCSEARQPEAASEQEVPTERASVAARSEHGPVAVHIGNANHEVRALNQCAERIGATAGHITAMELERVPSARRRRRVALTAPLYASNDSDVHAEIHRF